MQIPFGGKKMSSNIYDLVFENLSHPILSFLPIRDTIRCYLLINKRSIKQVTHFHCTQYHSSSSVDNGVMADDQDGPAILNLFHIFMGIVTHNVIFPVSKKSKQALTEETESGMFCKFGDDLHTIIAQVFTQWFSLPVDVGKGVLSACYDGILLRTQKVGEGNFLLTKRLIEDNAQYWYHSRVFDSFIILFERKDGTILVSEDLKRVYLVVDVDIRVSYKCTYYMTKDIKAMQKQRRNVKDCLPFGPIYGQKVTLLLFPFKNMIFTDGTIFHHERLTPAHIQGAVSAYLKAIDTNILITTLPKLQPTLGWTPPPVDENYISTQKIENVEGLLYLKSLPRRERTVWWFLCEQDETLGDEKYSIHLQAEERGRVFQMDGEKRTVPKEYIDTLVTACRTYGFRPNLLFMPMIDMFVVLNRLIGEDIIMQFQAEPCPEELYYTTLEDKLQCKVCKCTTTPSGKKVMKCTRCNLVYYCCQEHQREDWSRHKRTCGTFQL